MEVKPYKKTLKWVERHRFKLLLLSTLLVLVLPAFSGGGLLSEMLFWITMSFLFIQSLVAANVRKSRKQVGRIVVILLILVTWLQPLGIRSVYIDILINASLAVFFLSTVLHLLKFVRSSPMVNVNVLITSVNVYLLIGIVGGSLASLLCKIYPDAYNFPAGMNTSVFVPFIYYSFITMSTVGYGDITPRIPETQTLAYFISITGQLYVAIIIAFLVGKLLVHSDRNKNDSKEGTNRSD
jgi:hypothetical protein